MNLPFPASCVSGICAAPLMRDGAAGGLVSVITLEHVAGKRMVQRQPRGPRHVTWWHVDIAEAALWHPTV